MVRSLSIALYHRVKNCFEAFYAVVLSDHNCQAIKEIYSQDAAKAKATAQERRKNGTIEMSAARMASMMDDAEETGGDVPMVKVRVVGRRVYTPRQDFDASTRDVVIENLAYRGGPAPPLSCGSCVGPVSAITHEKSKGLCEEIEGGRATGALVTDSTSDRVQCLITWSVDTIVFGE